MFRGFGQLVFAFMATVFALYDMLKSIDRHAVIDTAIKETSDVIADLNGEQINKGVRADGSEITPTYSNLTIEIKRSKGQPTDRVTLRDTGKFYRGIRSEVIGDKIVTESTDDKNEKLVKKYGKKIFGLGDQYKREYLKEHLNPLFRKKIHSELGL